MPDQFEEVLCVEVGHTNLSFASATEVLNWIKEEIEFWRPFQTDDKIGHELKRRVTDFSGPVKQMASRYSEATNHDGFNGIQNAIRKYVQNGPKLTSDSAEATFIRGIPEDNPRLAAACWQSLALPMGDQYISGATATTGLILATLFRESLLPDGVTPTADSIESSQHAWNQFTKAARAKYLENEKEFTDLVSEGKTELETRAKEFRDVIATAESDHSALKKVLENELALKAPVRYWSVKAKEHKASAKCFSKAFGGALAGVVLVMSLLVSLWMIPQLENGESTAKAPTESQSKGASKSQASTKGESSITKSITGYWPVAVAAGLMALLVWPLRIISRMLMSHLHREADASERVTMAMTYLALLKTESGVDEKDRRLILEHLFRSSSTGIVKEDGAPNSPINAIGKAVTGQR